MNLSLFQWTLIILSPIWLYLLFRLISAACCKSFWQAKKQSKQEEQDDGKEG